MANEMVFITFQGCTVKLFWHVKIIDSSKVFTKEEDEIETQDEEIQVPLLENTYRSFRTRNKEVNEENKNKQENKSRVYNHSVCRICIVEEILIKFEAPSISESINFSLNIYFLH